MLSKNFASRAIGALLIAATLSFSALADTIRLKDGSLIKGKIVSFRNGRFVVLIGDGARRRELWFDASEIESIQFDAEPQAGVSRMPDSGRGQPSTTSDTATSRNYKVVMTDSTREAENRRPNNGSPLKTTASVPPKSPTSTPAAKSDNRTPSSLARPLSITARVLADNTANGWTNTGWIVRKGQRIRVSASGSVSLGQGRTATPAGLADVEDRQKLMGGVPTGALIAVIGDDNNDFIYIGAEREFTAARDGALYLGVNEGELNDNSGAYDVKIEIVPQ